MKWHLDGWDRTGGRAFASMRPQGAELLDREESWGPIVYIGPPSFRPEPISSTSVVLSAGRAAAFSPRTPENPDIAEIGFPNADAVAEFVRRAFVNSGTHEVVAAEKMRHQVSPGHESRRRAVMVIQSSGTSSSSRGRTRSIVLRSARRADAEPVKYETASALRRRNAHDWSAVESGALQLIATLVHQFPGAENVHRFNAWRASARALHRGIQELELWQFWKQGGRLLDLRGDWQLEALAKKVFEEIQPIEGKVPELGPLDPIWFATLLLSTYPNYPAGATQVGLNYLLRLRVSAVAGGTLGLVTEDAGLDDRYEAMLLWPVPAYAGLPVEIRNVGQLVMAFVSAPGSFEKVHPRIIDVVAFAAALFASKVEDRKFTGWRERAAQTWLAGSMPRWAFRKEAEQMILATTHAHAFAHA